MSEDSVWIRKRRQPGTDPRGTKPSTHVKETKKEEPQEKDKHPWERSVAIRPRREGKKASSRDACFILSSAYFSVQYLVIPLKCETALNHIAKLSVILFQNSLQNTAREGLFFQDANLSTIGSETQE